MAARILTKFFRPHVVARRYFVDHEDPLNYHEVYRETYLEHAKTLTHVDDVGKAAMVDVGQKEDEVRTASAKAVINVGPEVFKLIRSNEIQKGDVLTVAQVAGIMAAKKTSELIPLCHPISLTKVDVSISLSPCDQKLVAECVARCKGPTGVEMEALTGVSIAALTIYDMCKAVNKFIVIENVRLVEKTGGKSSR